MGKILIPGIGRMTPDELRLHVAREHLAEDVTDLGQIMDFIDDLRAEHRREELRALNRLWTMQRQMRRHRDEIRDLESKIREAKGKRS